ncbi:hypothetical protein PAPYR_6142 [Paratrimastix pyriformis]|uniref:t-SNARE coiled-coil homology domain-containing protein n=1 Tax=Paratrimastix pyriformis TaxID=342808 RepID=A0ABQ8UIF0_9EUKA|nr:hypothetical protein PAPYR_6142 [Paratrimastix pyriformis]|eukprot:GAFH01002753.1.p2 GENE.GAFH01002753.1~~GAFH01002753.1.p2  ORF type:complete len:279 (+),score=100.27 GAFH01002753.1:41-877(+)
MSSAVAVDISDLESAYQTFQKNVKEVELDLRERKKKAAEIKKPLRYMKNSVSMMRNILDTMRGKLPPGDGHVMSWKAKIDQLDATYNRLNDQVKQFEASTRPGAAGVRTGASGTGRGRGTPKTRRAGGPAGADDGATSTADAAPVSSTEMEYLPDSAKLDAGRAIVARSEKSLNNSMDMINDALRTGATAGAQLVRQTEQMENISSKLDEINDEVTQAKKTLRAIFTRLMTDKILILLLFLVIAGILAVIIISIVQGVMNRGGKIITPTATATPKAWF